MQRLTVALAVIALTVGGCGEWEAGPPGSFVEAGSLTYPRTRHTATLLADRRVLVVSGCDGCASAEIWDPLAGTFGPAGSLAEARYGHTATPLPDGRVLVVGGRGSSGDRLASAEVWDPLAGTFGPAGSLAEARYGHTATPLPDGRVLLLGGTWRPAEIWDPVTASSKRASSLAGAGYGGHTATLLPDGRVLIVGGGAGSTRVEMWDPALSRPSAATRVRHPRQTLSGAGG
jgi:hypothetical protein